MGWFEKRVTDMNPGEVLADIPIHLLISRLGLGIAQAQLALDQSSIQVAGKLASNTVSFTEADGEKRSRSLLELGFTPTFYQFTEATINLTMTVEMKVSDSMGANLTLNAGDTDGGGGGEGDTASEDDGLLAKGKRMVGGMMKNMLPFGATVTADYTRKFDYDVSGSSSVTTKLVTVPPPALFLEVIKENARLSTGDVNMTESS